MGLSPKGEQVLQITIACGVLETVAVLLRLLARYNTKAKYGIDDWLIVATLIPSCGMLIAGSFMINPGGGGQHANELSRSQLVIFLKALNATLLTYSLTIAMAKISILLLYRRIFTTPRFRTATLVVGCVTTAWAIAAILTLIFQCQPISALWNPDLTFTKKCIDSSTYYSAIAGANMVLDITVLCLPLWMVWNLKLDRAQKLMLSGVFALGTLTCFASLMRIVTINLAKDADLTYTLINPYIWSQIEAAMAIICACLITYRPLFAKINLNSFSWSGFSKRNNTFSAAGRSSDGELHWSDKNFARLEILNTRNEKGQGNVDVGLNEVKASAWSLKAANGEETGGMKKDVRIETSFV